MQAESEYRYGIHELNIDEDFRRLHIPMVEKKLKRLEQNIYQRGSTKPILVWNGYIVDGHKRYEIYHRRSIPFRIQTLNLSSRTAVMEWLCDKNLLRLDLTEEYRKYFIGKKLLLQYSLIKEPYTDTSDNDDTDGVPQNKYLLALQIGQAFNLSFVTILKYAQYTDAIDSIYACEPTIAEQILTSRVKVSHDNAMLISQLSPEELRKLRTGFDAGKYDRLVSSQIWHEVRTNRKTTTSRPRKKSEQPKAEIKNMPKYDPDAELLSLTLTIPMWKSSMERVKTTADFNHTSENAKNKLLNQLSVLSDAIEQLSSFIKEATNEQRNGAESGAVCAEGALRTDPDKESGIEPGISEESVTETRSEGGS